MQCLLQVTVKRSNFTSQIVYPDLQHPKTAGSQNVLIKFVCFAIQVAEQSLTESPTDPYTHLLVCLTSASCNYIIVS